MSQEHIKRARDAVAAFNRGDDLDAWLDEYWADDVDYRAVEGALDDHGPIHGKAELRAYLQDWLDMFDDFKMEPAELIDAGEDRVIAVTRLSGRAKLSGVKTDLDLRRPLHGPRREGRAGSGVLDEGTGPRSRRAAGVARCCAGDVPGARGARSRSGTRQSMVAASTPCSGWSMQKFGD